jgi:hypothetical protein
MPLTILNGTSKGLLVLGARIVYRKVPDSQSPAKQVKHIIPPLSPEL